MKRREQGTKGKNMDGLQKFKIEWHPRYELGMEEIDREHKKLFSIIHKVMELAENGEDRRAKYACREGVKFFRNYTLGHFAHEEKFMESLNYGGYERHKKIHDDLKNNLLPSMEKELEENDYSMDTVRHFLGICAAWLTTHIMGEDQAIMNRQINNHIQLEINSQEAGLEKLLQALLQQMYDLEMEPISKQYTGWDFGKAIFHELTFIDEKKEVTRIIFTVEEKLIFSLASQRLGGEVKRIDSFVSGVIKEVFLSLANKISFHMGMNGEYKSRSGILLSTDEIREIFRHRTILYSTLFKSSIGHFACSIYKR